MKKAIFALLMVLSLNAYTVQNPQEIPKSSQTQAQRVFQEVTITPKDILETVQRFYDEFKGGDDLLKRAEAYLVFPTVYEAGLVVGGKYGYGALVHHDMLESYYKVYSTSVGLKAGVKKYSLIIVFMTKEALKRFKNKEEWKVGLDTDLTFTSWKQGIDINSLDLTKDTIVIPFNDVGLMADASFAGTVFQKLP